MSLGQEVVEVIFLALLLSKQLLEVIKIQRSISFPSIQQSVHSKAQSSHSSSSIFRIATEPHPNAPGAYRNWASGHMCHQQMPVHSHTLVEPGLPLADR